MFIYLLRRKGQTNWQLLEMFHRFRVYFEIYWLNLSLNKCSEIPGFFETCLNQIYLIPPSTIPFRLKPMGLNLHLTARGLHTGWFSAFWKCNEISGVIIFSRNFIPPWENRRISGFSFVFFYLVLFIYFCCHHFIIIIIESFLLILSFILIMKTYNSFQ